MEQCQKTGLTTKMAFAKLLAKTGRGDYAKAFVEEKYPELYDWYCAADVQVLKDTFDLLKEK